MRRILAPLLVVVLSWSEVRAGGFEFPTNGTAALGRGGAFTARADDLVCMEYNPAGLINIPGTTFYVANNMSLFNMEFTRLLPDGTDAQPVSNQAGLFPIAPFVAMSTDAGTRDWRFSVAAFGPSAYGKTAYATDDIDDCMAIDGENVSAASTARRQECLDKNAPSRHMLVGTDMLQALWTVGAAYGRKGKWGVGVSLHWVDLMQARFSLFVSAYNPSFDFSEPRMDLKADLEVADRVGFATTVGGWWKPIESLEFGLSARVPPVDMNATGHTRLTFVDGMVNRLYQNGIESNGQDGLVAYDDGQLPDVDADDRPVGKNIPTSVQLTYPMAARAGARYVHYTGEGDYRRELFDVEADVVWEGWSALDEFAVQLDGYIRNTVSGDPASGAEKLYFRAIDIPKSYDDTWSFRLGGQVAPMPWFIYRLGGYYETAAARPEYSNLDFASFERMGFGTGASLILPLFTVSFAYSHIFQPTRNVGLEESKVYKQYPLLEEPKTDPEATAGAGRFESSYDIFSVAFSYSL